MKNNDLNLSFIVKQKANLSLFGIPDFDKFGTFKNILIRINLILILASFSHYFPQNNLSYLIRKMEIKRLVILKKKRTSRKNSFSSNFPILSFALIHCIDKEFIHENNIRIAQKQVL